MPDLDAGAWSLLVPAVAITAALATRRVYESLLAAILAGGVLAAALRLGDAATSPPGWLSALGGGFLQAVTWIVEGFTRDGHAEFILFILLLGGVLALMQRSGGVRAFGAWALRHARTRRRGQLITWGLGTFVLAVDDTFNAIAVGTVMRPVTDRLQVSREKLAYITDSTSSPVAILLPFSTWVGFVVALVAVETERHGMDVRAFATFAAGIPFNLYALIAVALVAVIAATRIEYGPMRSAERRAEHEGKVLGDGARPLAGDELARLEEAPGAAPRIGNLLWPILFLFATAPLMFLLVGGWPGVGALDALAQTRPGTGMLLATALTLCFCTVLYGAQGLLGAHAWSESLLTGGRAMVPALAILLLAWAVGAAATDLGLGTFVAAAVGADLDAAWIPLALFLASALMAFSTGTSFGTYAVMMPVAVGLVAAQGTEAALWLPAAVAAVLGGGVFGDHCSPISDTTVISSMATRCDHIDHVRTQIPYALTAAAGAAAGYAALAVTGSAWIAWTAAVLAVAAVLGAAWTWGRRAG